MFHFNSRGKGKTSFWPLLMALCLHSFKAHGSGVELHAHLFMKEGMSWLFQGDFNGPLQAKNWKSRFSSQANPETVIQSDLDILVVTLYAHPLLTLSMRDSIRRQIGLAQKFAAENPNWVIAKSPSEARTALSQKKHVLILALEGASGILESEADLVEFVDQKGIRIVNLLHLTDDGFGGAAFLKGIKAFSTPFAYLESLFHPFRDSSGNRLNSNGLTQKGREMAQSLIRHKVWIDLAHASDASQQELFPILERAKHPLLYTHTVLRKFHLAERGITHEQLQKVAESGGVVGLMPSEEMLEGTPPLQSTCTGSVHALATQYKEASDVIGMSAIAMGSDYNGGIYHLKPSCKTGTSLDRDGLWNIGQTQMLWRALENLGAFRNSTILRNTTHRFLEAWSKIWES